MEMLSDEAVAGAVQSHLVSVIRKWKNDPEFQLPALKRTIVTRWFNNPHILGSYSYREIDSDVLGKILQQKYFSQLFFQSKSIHRNPNRYLFR